MHKSDEIYREIVIGKGGGESEDSSNYRDAYDQKGMNKPVYPPIESHFLLPPQQTQKPAAASTTSSSGLKSMLSIPLKVRDSLKRLGKSKSMELVLEGTHDPKDEQMA